MATIQTYLNQIKNAIYGKDVRQAIHDGIQQCYYDGKAGSTDLEARQRLDTAEPKITSLESRMYTAESDIDTLDARVDQIVAPSGEAPSAAEVADGRIVDGITYSLIGDAIRAVNANLKSAINYLEDCTIVEPIKDYYINTAVSVGDTVSLTPVSSSSGFYYAIVDCVEGDTFVVKGTGGSSARLWCFIDSSNKALDVSPASASLDYGVLIAPSGASKLVLNATSDGIKAYKGKEATIRKVSLQKNVRETDTALRIIEPSNKLNPSTIVRGKAIYTNGSLVDNSTYFVSDYIPCNGGDVFYYVRKSEGGTYLDANVNHLAQYTENKTFIRRDDYVHTRTLESNCAYIRVDNPQTHLDASGAVASITFNSVPTTGDEIKAWFAPYIYLTADRFDANVNDLNKYKAEASVVVRPENELDLTNVLTDTIVSSSGDAYNNTCFTTNYFIPAEYGDVVTYCGINSGGTFYGHTAVKITQIGMYDADKNYLGLSGSFKNDFVIDQANCKYIRVSLPNAALSWQIASLSINAIPTKASLVAYHAPYYSATKPSQNTIRNRRVLWLGTSIPTYGYPQILARLCGCNMRNESIGLSGITMGITANITEANVCGITTIAGLYGLTQTIEQKQAMIDNWQTIASEISSSDVMTDDIKNTALASSYETIVDPYLNDVDLVVINHGYNDNTENAVAPENDKLNPHYLEGAYNWLIKHILEANPNIGIVIFGHYSDLPTSKETALQNVADRWNIPYYLLKNDLGWSNVQNINTTKRVNASGEWETITAADMTVQRMWLGDGIHPLGVATKRIAQVSQNVFADWLKMYCDDVN